MQSFNWTVLMLHLYEPSVFCFCNVGEIACRTKTMWYWIKRNYPWVRIAFKRSMWFLFSDVLLSILAWFNIHIFYCDAIVGVQGWYNLNIWCRFFACLQNPIQMLLFIVNDMCLTQTRQMNSLTQLIVWFKYRNVSWMTRCWFCGFIECTTV